MTRGGMRTLHDVPKHPREVRERMEVEAEVVILITGADALLRLTRDCRFPEAKARRLLNIAWEFGQKAEPCPGGYVHIWYHGKDDTKQHIFSVVEHIGGKQPVKVARKNEPRYTQSKNPEANREKATMPPRKTRSAPAPAPEPEVEEVDYQKFVEKAFSATMTDYIAWMDENIPGWDKMDVDRILVLGVSMYSHFQKSDFNIEQRAARKAEREATVQGNGDEPEPATRTRGAKAAAKPATASPARAGARTSGRTAKAPAKASTRGRTSGKAAAAAGGDAPF